MFKNFIIGVLTFIVFSLLVQNPANLDMIVKDVVTAKDMVVDGAEYVHKTIDKEFSVHSEEEFIKEHGEDNIVEEMENKFKKMDKEFENKPSGFTPFGDEGKIIEETFFDER